ncbi:uncharacterized protein BDCG_17513 [Blastomyces dermatitidis ER-3]|uniref:Uncharacterized protein n=1 Tax=Ajellomyces dermatitidis (strain ER-3 / ATCC MYA-2586) TaxID=559297 RepID=A0ABX2VZ19_AJEDR|nr:uncharacterized protein BDCG_17513 [Blastomyces dermatitidis ER-3]EQL29254.1 hypothetical protein BDFG_08107 [Blastomyces dermatitidis ATCC 26199]OAT02385.1 hypothetical protein BDCG_17513 [Blastomyces dermatitidis ER-3]
MSAPTFALATAALQAEGNGRKSTEYVERRDRLLHDLPKVQGFGGFLARFPSKPAREEGVPDDNAIATAIFHVLAMKSKSSCVIVAWKLSAWEVSELQSAVRRGD